jgi:hydrogenase maturation protease
MATKKQEMKPGDGRRILVAGIGNVLRGDDGIGNAVAQQLAQQPDLPPTVTVVEVGIGGISLVHEMLGGYDVLLIVDALDRGGAPGTPSRALILAKALGVLPPSVYLLGCQPTTCDDLVIGLSEPVERAVAPSVERLVSEIHRLTGVPACDH